MTWQQILAKGLEGLHTEDCFEKPSHQDCLLLVSAVLAPFKETLLEVTDA